MKAGVVAGGGDPGRDFVDGRTERHRRRHFEKYMGSDGRLNVETGNRVSWALQFLRTCYTVRTKRCAVLRDG